MFHPVLVAVLAAGLSVPAGGTTTPPPAWITMPTATRETIVFCCEGDLWSVSRAGGTAHRLTRHAGTERFPRLSPDGRTIAFSASFSGSEEVWTMPVDGGPLTRLTESPGTDQAVAWRPDGTAVVFRSARETPHETMRLWEAPARGGAARLLPLADSSMVAFSADGRRAVFERIGREGRTWKRYRGGRQQDLWWTDLSGTSFRRLTDPGFTGSEGYPMWIGDRLYFVCDRDGVMNLWSMTEDGRDLRQHTRHAELDIRWPCSDGQRIVYVMGGDLWSFDPVSGADARIPVVVPSERLDTLPRIVSGLKWMGDPVISPDARRVLVPMRGDLFLAAPGPDEARTIELTGTPGSRERSPCFSPDGEQVVCVSDSSGEEQLVLLPTDGSGKQTQLTTGPGRWFYQPSWSPDGERIAWGDQTGTLSVMHLKTRVTRVVDRSRSDDIENYVWSPDGRWLAYTRAEDNEYHSIVIHDVIKGTTHRVTEPDTESYSPAWDPEGKYLYFLSDRTLNPLPDTLDRAFIFTKTTRPYLVMLRQGARSPLFPRELDEEKAEEKDKEKEKEKERAPDRAGTAGGTPRTGQARKESAAAPLEPLPSVHAPRAAALGAGAAMLTRVLPSPASARPSPVPRPSPAARSSAAPRTPLVSVTIDVQGLGDRIVELPTEPGNYDSLVAVKGRILFVSRPPAGIFDEQDLFNQDHGARGTLLACDIAEREVKALVEGLTAYCISADGKKAVVRKGSDVRVVDLGSPEPRDEKPGRKKGVVSVDRIHVRVDPIQEWRQIMRESWRLERAFFWARDMAGVDWEAAWRRYSALLPRIATRAELNDLIGEMIGELGTSHTYAFGGDVAPPPRPVEMGLLGADIVPEPSGGWRVTRVLRGRDWSDSLRSPLAASHAHVAAGEVIRAVNRHPIATGESLNLRLEGLAHVPVLLSVSAPTTTTTRDVLVKPLASEQRLRYVDWVRGNRERVDRETDGRCGYLHLPDMLGEGLVEFTRAFYPAVRKRGLIVDARHNAGGYVSQAILEKLQKTIWGYRHSRDRTTRTVPVRALDAHLIWLTDQHAGSDGDIGPAGFQRLGLGPVLGTRSWGGVVGIRIDKYLVDGGVCTVPQSAFWSPGVGWDLENRGVLPDIPVDIGPADQVAGRDVQLERAIAWVKDRLAREPKDPPAPPPYPDRSLRPYRK